MKKNNIYILIITLLFFFQFACALEATYPSISGYTIDENSGFVDYVSYAFMMIISIGAILLLLVLIGSGINFIMAGGDPGRISKAKEMAINGFAGMVLLLSVYWILNTINPAIIDVENPEAEKCYGGGILITIQKGSEIIKNCINSSVEKIDGDIIEAKWFYKEGDVKEVWVFNKEKFEGPGVSIYQDAIDVFGCCSPRGIPTDISNMNGKKSIYIIPRIYGFYFYDTEGWGITNNLPYYVSKSQNIDDSFNNKASSFSTVCSSQEINPNTGNFYCPVSPKAIIFQESNYSGKCSLLYSESSNSLNSPSRLPDLGKNEYIGNNKISSIIVSSLDLRTIDEEKGRIILYNNLNCAEVDSSTPNTHNSICEINIKNHQFKVLDMKKNESNTGSFPCDASSGSEWDKDSYIESIRIPDGQGAVVVMGTNGTCKYYSFKSVGDNNCINSLRGSGVYDGGTFFGVRPEKVIVIPTN